MKTLGIDPGSAIMGFGLVSDGGRKLEAIDFGCIKTPKENTPSERLLLLHERLEALLKKLKPDHMAVESLFFCNNSKTAMAVGQARGIILLSAARANINVSEYTPLQVKMALTGYGKADKRQVQHMVKNILKLKDIPRPDDAADALAIAICHLHSHKMEGK